MYDFEMPIAFLRILRLVQSVYPDAVIGGGALRDTLLSRPINDVDVIIPVPWEDTEPAYHIGRMRSLFGHVEVVLNRMNVRNLIGLVLRTNAFGYDIDLVYWRGLNHPTDHLKYSDFGICRIVTDGTNVYIAPEFIRDVEQRTLTLLHPNPGSQIHARKLARKYPDYELIA